MHKFKTVWADEISTLEKDLNTLCSDLDVIDVKYQATQWGEHDARYTALIIYRVEEPTHDW